MPLNARSSVVTAECKEWEAKCQALTADADRVRHLAAEEARLQTLKNLATTMHEVRTPYPRVTH